MNHGIGLLIAIVLFVIVLVGLFVYRVRPNYQPVFSVVALVAALLLFLAAIGVFAL